MVGDDEMDKLPMPDRTEDTQPPNVEIDSLRFLQRTGEQIGKLSIVVGGVHYVWNCPRAKMFAFIASGIEALGKQEQSADPNVLA